MSKKSLFSGDNLIIGGAVLAAIWLYWKNSNPANAANVNTNPTSLTDSLDSSAANLINSAFTSVTGGS